MGAKRIAATKQTKSIVTAGVRLERFPRELETSETFIVHRYYHYGLVHDCIQV